MLVDLVYNVLLLLLTGDQLTRLHRDPTWFSVARAHLLLFVVGVPLAIAAHFDLFGTLRMLAYLLFLQLPILSIASALLLRRAPGQSWPARLLLAVGLLPVAVAFDAFLIEPRSLETTRYEIATSEVHRPIRIAVVADLQTDRIGTLERELFERLAAQRPDLVLYTGDYLQESDPDRHRQLELELNALIASVDLEIPLGQYAVLGDVDTPIAGRRLFEGLDITILARTTTVRAGPLLLTGLSLADSDNPSLRLAGEDGFHLVFGHRPDFALGDIGGDLLVAGHTHGGQVRLPGFGPLITYSRVPRAWSDGRTELDSRRTLVVSRGIGMERGKAPRLRFFCRPQLVLVDLVPTTPALGHVNPADSG